MGEGALAGVATAGSEVVALTGVEEASDGEGRLSEGNTCGECTAI